MNDVQVSSSDEVVDLPAFFEYLEKYLDVRDQASILAAGSTLLALARNKRFLAEFLIGSLARPARFQEGNGYAGPVIMLGGGDGYMVRALGWPAAHEESRTPSHLGVHAYDGAAQVAHNHNFSILTTCYAGPGYETDLYEWHTLNHGAVRSDDRIDMRFCGRKRLEQGRLMFYRAFEDAHVQYEPPAYSVSLNLVVHPTEQDLGDQYYFDIENRSIVTAGGLGNDRRTQLIQLASSLRDPSFLPYLKIIADTHPADRVRETARHALDQDWPAN
jgi:hypothetical protein